MSVISDIEGEAGKIGAAASAALAGSAGPAVLGVVQLIFAQIQAGVRFTGQLKLDVPGPFDPEIDVVVDVHLENGSIKLKELSIKPSLPKPSA